MASIIYNKGCARMTWEMERISLEGSAQTIVDSLLQHAACLGVSDIHIEPLQETVGIRFRRDGVLFPAGELPKTALETITARIKIMAALDIANKRLPQDGRLVWRKDGRVIDMRVSTMPTIRGEKTVIRLLDAGSVALHLDRLGMEPETVRLLRQLIHSHSGLFILSGPTGSGKSTTLYAALQELHSSEISIATLEDPVEYRLQGISQSQINSKSGLEFQNGLRALLRQDPDVLVIGEIRDAETARIAIRAALTGHLVFTTLHAASAAEAPVRLIDMGIEPYLVADALIGIASQRLARRFCPQCLGRKRQNEDKAAAADLRCSYCFNSGYAGRFCLCEIIPVKTHVRATIRQNGGIHNIRKAAAADGAVFMEAVIKRALQENKTDRAEIERIYDM